VAVTVGVQGAVTVGVPEAVRVMVGILGAVMVVVREELPVTVGIQEEATVVAPAAAMAASPVEARSLS
jgi:hypothetical protein